MDALSALTRTFLATVLAVGASAVFAQQPLPSPPPPGDDSAPALRAYQQALRDHFGGDYNIPLDVKAEYFQWAMFRYNYLPGAQVYDYCTLADEPGIPPRHVPGSDTSTWNGALLCGLSYKYAVTKDPLTLKHIELVLRGMRLCLDVTRKRGHIVRSIIPEDGVHHDDYRPCTASDGRRFFCLADPAKGTYNQIIGGYAKVMMHAWQDLPPDVQRMCHEDLISMVLHVIDHDYHLTDAAGRRTTYGDISPVVASVGVPFNAQVAYHIVATGDSFPPEDRQEHARIAAQYQRLRYKHHVFYEDPWNLVRPQMVAASPLIQNNNDRAHAMFAAFAGLELELHQARRTGKPPEAKFLYRLGQTMLWGMTVMEHYPNALTHLMWAGLLSDPAAFDAIVRNKRNTVRAQAERCLVSAVDELRRYKLDRFYHYGHEYKGMIPAHVDQAPLGYRWHQPETAFFQQTGDPTNHHFAAFCYLHAYWLMRYYRLDEHPQVARLALPVLRRTSVLQ